MGTKKAAVEIDGRTIIERTLAELDRARAQVTVLGREPIEGRKILMDAVEGAGPASALLRFSPTMDQVFVVSCDIPLFKADVIAELQARIGDRDAVIPLVDGRPQYLCALYSARAFEKWQKVASHPEGKELSMRNLVAVIDAVETDGIDPRTITGINTPDELEQLLLNT